MYGLHGAFAGGVSLPIFLNVFYLPVFLCIHPALYMNNVRINDIYIYIYIYIKLSY